MPTLAVLQLGQHGVGHIDVVAVPCAVGNAECVHVGVLAEVLQLVLLVVGVDGHEHGTNLCRSVEEGQPVGYVGGPDADVGTFLDTDSDEAFGEVIDALVELAPGEAEVAGGMDNLVFIGRRLSPMLEPLSECTLIELIALTSSLGGIVSRGKSLP